MSNRNKNISLIEAVEVAKEKSSTPAPQIIKCTLCNETGEEHAAYRSRCPDRINGGFIENQFYTPTNSEDICECGKARVDHFCANHNTFCDEAMHSSRIFTLAHPKPEEAHTPTPWKIDPVFLVPCIVIGGDDSDNQICQANGSVKKRTANQDNSGCLVPCKRREEMKPTDMTDEQLRVKVAEILKWDISLAGYGYPWFEGIGFGEDQELIPNYPADLNACASFELPLHAQARFDTQNLYVENLRDIVYRAKHSGQSLNFAMLNATARQRCLAFVMTMEEGNGTPRSD